MTLPTQDTLTLVIWLAIIPASVMLVLLIGYAIDGRKKAPTPTFKRYLACFEIVRMGETKIDGVGHTFFSAERLTEEVLFEAGRTVIVNRTASLAEADQLRIIWRSVQQLD